MRWESYKAFWALFERQADIAVADRGAKSNEKGWPMIPWKKESCMKKPRS